MRGAVTGHRVRPMSANIRMGVIRIQLPVHSPHTWNLLLSYAMAQSGVTRAHGRSIARKRNPQKAVAIRRHETRTG